MTDGLAVRREVGFISWVHVVAPTQPQPEEEVPAAPQGTALAFESPPDAPQQSAVQAFESETEAPSQSPALAFAEQTRAERAATAFSGDERQPSSASAPPSSAEFASPPSNTPASTATQSTTLEPQAAALSSSLDAKEVGIQPGSPSPNTSATSTSPPSLIETGALEPQLTSTDLLRSGTLLPATLQKDILLTEGETKQVIADSSGAWCQRDTCPNLRWIGTATLTPSGRLNVQFTQAVMDEQTIAVKGVAYGMDNAERLPARLADTTPTLLADLLRAGAGGVTDYVKARTNQGSVTTGEGQTTIETDVPGLLESVLRRAAGTVQIPDEQTGVIRVAAVEEGTKFEVLVLP